LPGRRVSNSDYTGCKYSLSHHIKLFGVYKWKEKALLLATSPRRIWALNDYSYISYPLKSLTTIDRIFKKVIHAHDKSQLNGYISGRVKTSETDFVCTSAFICSKMLLLVDICLCLSLSQVLPL
jgi:hypothetical protein